jgi:hypothetical protein
MVWIEPIEEILQKKKNRHLRIKPQSNNKASPLALPAPIADRGTGAGSRRAARAVLEREGAKEKRENDEVSTLHRSKISN